MARPRQVTDEQVLETAREVFMEHGPRAPVSMIAGRLGLSDAALFKRFGTKRELLLAAVMPPEEPPFMGLLQRPPVPGEVQEQLVGISTGIVRLLKSMIPRISILHAAGIDPRQALRERYEVPPPIRVLRALSAWIAAAKEAGALAPHVEPDATAMMIMGSLHFRAFLFGVIAPTAAPQCTQELPDPEAYARQVVRSLWSGIAPNGAME